MMASPNASRVRCMRRSSLGFVGFGGFELAIAFLPPAFLDIWPSFVRHHLGSEEYWLTYQATNASLRRMADNRMGGTALIAASVANIIVIALHPTGHQLFDAGERFNLIARLAVGVHWVALLAMTISFLGALALTQYLNAPNRLSIAAQVMYGFAVMAGMLAVVFSGFMGVGLARKIVAAAPPGKEYWEMMAGYNFGLNQVFA